METKEALPSWDQFIAREVEAKLAGHYMQEGSAEGWHFARLRSSVKWVYFGRGPKPDASKGTYWYVDPDAKEVLHIEHVRASP